MFGCLTVVTTAGKTAGGIQAHPVFRGVNVGYFHAPKLKPRRTPAKGRAAGLVTLGPRRLDHCLDADRDGVREHDGAEGNPRVDCPGSHRVAGARLGAFR
jgi:hypothetical protein